MPTTAVLGSGVSRSFAELLLRNKVRVPVLGFTRLLAIGPTFQGSGLVVVHVTGRPVARILVRTVRVGSPPRVMRVRMGRKIWCSHIGRVTGLMWDETPSPVSMDVKYSVYPMLSYD